MEPRPDKTNQCWVVSLVALGLGLVLLGGMFVALGFLSNRSQPGTWTYSQLIAEARAHRVSKLTIDGRSGVAVDGSGKTYDVTLPSDTSALTSQLPAEGGNVQYLASRPDRLGAPLSALLLLSAMALLLWWLMRGTRASANRATSFGGPGSG